jgi:endogenous inhibitor of DNA gyrase (YacG/DUF329 family)
MDFQSKICDECGAQKREVNHWLVAVERADFEGILFVPAEAVVPVTDRATEFQYRDICGQGCAHTRLSRWLDSLKQIDYEQTPQPANPQQPTESEAAV